MSNTITFNADTAAQIVGHVLVKSDVIAEDNQTVDNLKLIYAKETSEVYVVRVKNNKVSNHPLTLIEGELVELPIQLDLDAMIESAPLR